MMKMLKTIYKSGMMAAMLALSACSSDSLIDTETIPGDTSISLVGTMTRADGVANNTETLQGYTNLKLSAKTTENTPTDYFTNVALTVSNDAVSSVSGAYYLTANAYYPLGNKEISLFAHTGNVDNSGKIALTAGTEKANDYLISNGDDGTGTKVSSKNEGSTDDARAKELKFRHIMTKVEVVIKITDTTSDRPTTTPQNIEISFKDGNNGVKVYKEGTYALTTSSANDTNNTATATGTTLYTLKQGVHYLIPTGETLSGKKGILKSLKIDDYTATDADLNTIEIPQAEFNGTKSDFILKPGLSYRLTFEIERLRLNKITVTKKDWDIKSGDGTWGYDPHKVEMNMTGGYTNSGDAQITKIVLRHAPQNNTGSYQYIGTCEKENGSNVVNAKFLTLPTDMSQRTLTADLYTKDGLLIEQHSVIYVAATESASQKFSINLNANGMTKDNSNSYYEVQTPLQFYNLMNNPEAGKKYKLMNNIDVNSLALTIPQKDFPENAELDGDGHSILHMNANNSGLFKENKGTLKNLHIAFSSIDASGSGDTYAGGICSINSGTIEGCINEADIKSKDNQTVGGICGKNDTKGKILACLNTGNIPEGTTGGICGENSSTDAGAIKACINAGMLHGSSNYTGTAALGGICGYQSAKSNNKLISSCYWLTGTASNTQTFNDERAIGSFAEGIDENDQAGYTDDTTNMTETKLRTEAVTKLNNALSTTSSWEFKYEKDTDTNTYKTVWPIPVKKSTTNP